MASNIPFYGVFVGFQGRLFMIPSLISFLYPYELSRQYHQCMKKSGGVTIYMRKCNGDELKRQDRRLNVNYKKAMAVLDSKHRDELKKVQKLWIKYRDARCGFLFGLTGGTLDLLAGGSCYVDMTARRADELEDIVDMMGPFTQ